MSTINPKKLKVAELREELLQRGLETKGTKPILVKRLEEALAAEGVESAGADDSILDDSTADTTADLSANTSTLSQTASEEPTPTEKKEEPVVETEESKDAQAPVEEPPAPAQTGDTETPNQVDDAEETEASKPEAEKEEHKEEASPPESAREESTEATAGEVAEGEMETEPAEEEAPEAMQEGEAPEADAAAVVEEFGVEPEDDQHPDDQPEEFQVMDSVGDDMDAPEADQNVDEGGERRATKRHHDDDYDRDRRRYGRSRSPHHHSRSRDHEDHHHRHHGSASHSPGRHSRRSVSPERQVEPEENEDWLTATNVQLDRYNCDLNLRVNDDGFKCCPLTIGGFAFMWAGVRSAYGVKSGKVAYEVKILEHLKVDLPEEESNPHVVRVGFSTDSSSLQLGEEANSYGYGGTGKASKECKFVDYGEKFQEGDVITAYLDFESSPAEISFAKNGKDLGKCFDVDAEKLGDEALFAHILTKNCEFEVNFGHLENPQFPIKEGFTLLNNVSEDERIRGAVPPVKKEDAEIIMMCGLPGAGKTYWAEKHAAANPEKRYYILGTNSIIDKMKVMGLPRKKNYAGRWDVLIEKATKCLNRQFGIASQKKRNYILDQTNVYPSAQRRKMRPFEGFQRKAVVIVPTDEEFKRRVEERTKVEGKDVPDQAVMEMKANFQLPEEGSMFDSVEFTELSREEAQKLVTKYNEEGKAALPPAEKRWRNDRPYSGGQRDYNRGGRDSYRGGYDRDRRGGYRGGYSPRDGGYDRRGGGRGGYDDRRRGGGGYMGYSSYDRRRAETHHSSYRDNRDRRDHRDNRSYGDRSRGQSGWGGKSQSGGWGQQGWGGNQGGWGNQGHWNQSNWGNQQGYQGNWGSGQWGNYSGNQSGWGQQNQGNWGQQGYNYNQQQGYSNYGSSGSSSSSSNQGWGSSGGYNSSGYSNWGK